MASPRLSIIVPVFNAASFLAQCLDSLLNQDVSGFEIVCVDDGSTDASSAILQAYAASHPGIFNLIRQPNGGAAVARNNGIAQARGKYFIFVDADDWVSPTYISRLLALAEENQLDLAHGNGTYCFEGERENFSIYGNDLPETVTSGQDVLRRRLADKTFLHFPVLQVCRCELVRDAGMRFIPGRLHEDVLWTTELFLRAERVMYVPEPGYFYRRYQRLTDVVVSDSVVDVRLQREIASAADNARGLVALADTVADSELQRLLSWQLVDGALSIYHHVKKIADTDLRRQILRQLRISGFSALLWRHATEFCQYRRIAKAWLKSL